MKQIEKQQENVKHLLQLVKDNPELNILPMVATECVDSDDASYWMARWSKTEVDEYYAGDERIYFKSIDAEELIDEYMSDMLDELGEDGENEDIEQYAVNKVDSLNWVKAIIVHINPLN